MPSSKSNTTLPLAPSEYSHDYALLEMLFLASFESRFVNPTPSCILPGYFNATFNHVVSTPILLFPMPPLAPLPPLPEVSRSQRPPKRPVPPPPLPSEKPRDYSLPPISPTIPLESHFGDLSPLPSAPASAKSSFQSQRPAENYLELERIDPTPNPINITSPHVHSVVKTDGLGSVAMPAFAPRGETTEMGGQAAYDLFCMDVIAHLDEHAAHMHLRRMTGLVESAREAMVDELLAMVVQGDKTLERFGWEEDEYNEDVSKEKFDLLWEQFIADMHARISLWYPMTQYGWKYPRRDPMTKAELLDEERLRHAILEARRFAKPEEVQPTMRAIRLLVGIKDS